MKFGLGCIPGKKDIRDFKINSKNVMAISYPRSFECEKKTKIKNQSSVGSCVAHATSTILEYHYGPSNILSTNFIYGIHYLLYGSEGPGIRLREACKIVSKYGDPELRYCPGNTEVPKVYKLSENTFNDKEAMENAALHKIDNYVSLISSNDIKYALVNYGPVLAAIEWFSDSEVKNKILIKQGYSEGLHAIVIVGWNEDGWICQNSWGVSWGNRGYFILPYEYGINESYSFVPASSLTELKIPCKLKVFDLIYKVINWFLNL